MPSSGAAGVGMFSRTILRSSNCPFALRPRLGRTFRVARQLPLAPLAGRGAGGEGFPVVSHARSRARRH
jgi:hypothetical protein